MTLDVDQTPGARRLAGFPFLVEDLEDPLRAGERLGHPITDLTEPLQRTVKQQEVAIESKQCAGSHPASDHFDAAEQPERDDPDRSHQHHRSEQQRAPATGPNISAEQAFILLFESPDLVFLQPERLDHAAPPERFPQLGGELRPRLPPLVEQLAHSPPEHEAPDRDHRDGQCDTQRQPPIQQEHHYEYPNECANVDDRVRQTTNEEVLQRAGIVGNARYQRANLVLVIKAQGQHLELPVELAADVGGYPRPEPGYRGAVRPLGAPGDQTNYNQESDIEREQ